MNLYIFLLSQAKVAHGRLREKETVRTCCPELMVSWYVRESEIQEASFRARHIWFLASCSDLPSLSWQLVLTETLSVLQQRTF